MTRDDIIRLARQAELKEAEAHDYRGGYEQMPLIEQQALDQILRFAALVAAAAVRETSAEYRLGWNDGAMMEREACAKVCERLADMVSNNNWVAIENRKLCATEIRKGEMK